MFRTLLPLLLVLGCTDKDEPADTSATDSVADADTDTDTDTDADTDTDTDTDTTAPDGGALFASICAGCHGPDGTGGRGGPDITHEMGKSDEQLTHIILEGEGGMPPQDLTEAQAQAVIDWMRANF